MKKEKQLETILTICMGLIVIYCITHNKYILYLTILIGVSGLIIEKIAMAVTWLWTKLSEGLGFISSKLLLSAIFYLILSPIAFLFRLFKKGQLNLKNDKVSLFKTRNHLYTSDDFENLW
jgi:Saxitoxin biosynthesis operon protein SxtJ